MNRFPWLCAAVAVLGGCAAASAIPEGYTGPTATIRDSAFSEGSTRGRFFFVSEVNGKTIRHSLGATRADNQGKGFSLTPTIIERKVPAQRLTLKLEGKNAYGAPIQEMINSSSMYSVAEMVEVELMPDLRYVVRGELSDQRRFVWLEEEASGARVGRVLSSK